VLTPIFDPNFSEHSYGFRPGRSAQDAVRAAQQYAQEGKDWVVDLDITKFFDQVKPRHSDGPDRESDPGQTGVALDWEVPAAGSDGERVGGSQREGTPQGGPLSPLLATSIWMNSTRS